LWPAMIQGEGASAVDPTLRFAKDGASSDTLFGSWEMNWMAYNYPHDVELPGSVHKPLVYFMYPQAETSEGRVDPFDPNSFKYEITSREVS
jgi:hypothetical protein